MTVIAPDFKDPHDIVPYSIDVSHKIGNADAVTSYSWFSDDFEIESHSRSGNVISALVSGGVAPVEGYQPQTITCRVTTGLGFQFDETVVIRVRDVAQS